jgi:hypothetical protein
VEAADCFHCVVTGIETVAIALGATVVKSAAKIWFGDRQFAADVSADLVDALAGRLSSTFDQRRVTRFFDDCADTVAKRLVLLLDAEFDGVPGNERVAAILAVQDTFAKTALTDESLFQADLDARLVERQLRPEAVRTARRALLSMGGEQVYWLVLRESCAYLVEVVTTLPRFQAGALTEVLRRETLILSTLSRVLDRLPERRGADDFAVDYRRVVANKLDRLELLGVTLAEANRRYPLSIGYISLSVGETSRGGELGARGAGQGGTVRAESILARAPATLLMGSAGSGKTTLLQWLAVRSARGDFAGPLADVNGTVPFFIPLRRYVDRGLPSPEEFPLAVGSHIAREMPERWVHDLLRTGNALILVDGVDEMPESQRDRVRTWLTDLVLTFPNARYVVTSRPAAIEEGWLNGLRFTTAELQPMSPDDRERFVRQWHQAVGAELLDTDGQADLADYERALLASIDADRHLRALSVNPLLCALLCALNRERRTHLPADRMETYAAALDMLLDRRDRERGVTSGGVPLTRTDKVLLLQDIAFWLVRNGMSDAPADRVTAQIARSVQHLRGVTSDAAEVFRALMERSGLLREPTVRRVDFVHRTFQEYLAGKAAVENDEIGLLVKNAHDDQWREVVVMAAGHARPDQCAELLHGVIRRGRRDRRGALLPLAVVAAQSARRIDPQVRAEIDKATEELVPPGTDRVAEALAGTGEPLIAMLRARPPRTTAQATASIHALSAIGGSAALSGIAEILTRAADTWDGEVAAAVVRSWRFFKPAEYMEQVLVPGWPAGRELLINEPAFLDVLPMLAGLTSVRCDLENFGGSPRLDTLALSRELRSVMLTGCDSGLDLTPLSRLPLLHDLTLWSPDEAVDTDPLARIPGLRALKISCGTALGALDGISSCPVLNWLDLTGCDDLRSLDVLPELPGSIEGVSLSGFEVLSSLAGAGRHQAVRALELFGCPALTDLDPISGMTSLERIGIGIEHVDTVDLSPLAALPRLREVTLMGNWSFDLSGLRGKQDLCVRVPANSALKGARELGAGTAVIEFAVPSRLTPSVPEQG